MIVREGKSVFKGVAIGKIFVYKKAENAVTKETITDVDAELARFEEAKAKAMEQLKRLYEKALRDVGEEEAMIFDVHQMLLDATGKNVEVMVYGDGAFKDPSGKIWELADPVVSPGYTEGLRGVPNELKLKYLADNEFADLSGEALREAIKGSIRAKDADLKGQMASEGTTPRQLTDLIGSLCDLTSGSGDKGTPVIVVQNYFKNYAE